MRRRNVSVRFSGHKLLLTLASQRPGQPPASHRLPPAIRMHTHLYHPRLSGRAAEIIPGRSQGTLRLWQRFGATYNDTLQAQSDLILPSPLPLASLSEYTQEISGFFIVETNVLQTTNNFRSERDVIELWDLLIARLIAGIDASLTSETDPDVFLKAKECLLGFIMTVEAPYYSTQPLNSFIMVLFEKYAKLLESHFSKRFETVSSSCGVRSIICSLDRRLSRKTTTCQCRLKTITKLTASWRSFWSRSKRSTISAGEGRYHTAY